MLANNRGTVIGADLELTGEVRGGSTIEIQGLVQGTVEADHVVIGPGGRLLGILKATSAEIHGLLLGNVAVRQLLSIGSTGVVRGDVRYGLIAMADGGELSAEVRNIPPDIAGDFEIVVRRGRTVALTVSDITAFDPDDAAGSLTFTVARPENGFVARTGAPRQPIDRFTQSELLAGTILFAHDGNGEPGASFDVVVTDKSGASSGAPRTVQVTVV
jgi:cytoskeletal protein CcmA (bactofilin family)